MVDPNIVGISPTGVGELASAFQRHVSETNRLVAAYRGQFASMGVPTASLDAAYRNLGWAEDQIPMLRRRVELAEKIDEGVGNPFINLGFPKDMVTAGAGNISFVNEADAQRAGEADGGNLKKALGKGPLAPELDSIRPFLQEVLVNSGDPAYCDALIKQLGPESIARISHIGLALKRQGDSNGADFVFGSTGAALATASHHFPDVNAWLKKVTFITSERQPTSLIAPLLRYGDFDPKFLERVGMYELNAALNEPDVDRSKAIWAALASHPVAASLLYNLDLPKIMKYTVEGRGVSSLSGWEMASFAAVTRAATIGVRGEYPDMADGNIEAIIQYFKDHPKYHTADPIRDAHADIIRDRWSDLVYSFSSPFTAATESPAGDNPMRSGVEVSPKTWKNFLTDTMRHASAAAKILEKTDEWVSASQQAIAAKRWPIDHSRKTPDGQMPNFWENIVIGKVKSEVMASGVEALRQLNVDQDHKAARWVGAGEVALGELYKNRTDVVQYFKDLGTALAENEGKKFDAWAKDYVKSHYGDQDVRQVSALVDRYSTDYRAAWEYQVRNIWSQRTARGYKAFDSVEYGASSYDGDPSIYEKRYNTKLTYTDRNGHRQLLSVADISKDWNALLAYNEWLGDPAVSNSVWHNAGGIGGAHD